MRIRTSARRTRSIRLVLSGACLFTIGIWAAALTATDAYPDVPIITSLDPSLSVRMSKSIWLFEQMTVRASQQTPPLDVPLPAKNKRASLTGRARFARA